MKHLLTLLVTIISSTSIAQDYNCYSHVIEGGSLSNANQHWGRVKVSAPRETLINFLRACTEFSSCNYAFQTPEDIISKSRKVDCLDEVVQVEFTEAKDVLQFYNELKDAGSIGDNSIDLCISSSGEISFSYNNDKYGSVQVTSAGNISVSAKGEDENEYKVNFGSDQ